MTTSTIDPWAILESPTSASSLSAKRVDASHSWDFFWATDSSKSCLLLLQHSNAIPLPKLPKVKGFDISRVPDSSPNRALLAFKLTDPAHRDVFHRLCLDVIEATRTAETDQQAVDQAIARTWRWHHLLRGGSGRLLSEEEQRGLVGELLVLEALATNRIPSASALTAWRGPLNGPIDYDFGQSAIEVKTVRGLSATSVQVSNEHQLDTSGHHRLFLVVVRLDRAAVPTDDGFTITELVGRVRDAVLQADGSTASQFDDLLGATGFSWDDDYSEFRWLDLGQEAFLVTDGFPRIEFSELRPLVSSVSYTIGLAGCQPYHLEAVEMIEEIRRGGSGAEY